MRCELLGRPLQSALIERSDPNRLPWIAYWTPKYGHVVHPLDDCSAGFVVAFDPCYGLVGREIDGYLEIAYATAPGDSDVCVQRFEPTRAAMRSFRLPEDGQDALTEPHGRTRRTRPATMRAH